MNEPVPRAASEERRREIVRVLIWVLLALGLLTLIYRRLAAGLMLATGDLQTYFHPYWSEIIRSLHAGKLPLWNSYLFAGAPLLANSQAGVFYPLNWPLWLLARATPLGAARAMHLSVLIHLGLAAMTTFALARRLGMSPVAAALSGLFYAGSGFLGIHVEHLNQLQGLAWLPLVLLPGPKAAWLPPPMAIVAWALVLLAGHTQMAFIAGVGLVLWRVGLLLIRLRQRRGPGPQGTPAFRVALSWVGLLPYGLGVVAAMAQLAPTLQLTRFSTRSGGLPWREAVSFSVAPWALLRVLLPPYGFEPNLPEGVAYLGVSGLALGALGLWWGLRHRWRWGFGLAFLAGGGVVLALGGYNPLYALAVRLRVPGLIHFRAPARFLALTVIGGALLAGRGADTLMARLPSEAWGRRVGWAVLWLVAAAELMVAAEQLPHADATVPAAYTDLRPATAFLMSAAQAGAELDRSPARFLSISQMLFEVGDKSETALIYDDVLLRDALWNLWVSAKQREVLAPNLPMTFGVPAADGYDGGLLPLRHYGVFSRLLLPDGTLDGRLRENLPGVPESRWLSLLGVQFLLTDKTGDAWVDDVFYDRQFQPKIAPGRRLTIASLPPDFDANALGLLYEGSGGKAILTLPSGEIVRELPPAPAHSDEMGVVRVRWPGVEPVEALSFAAGSSPLKLLGASLVDERTGAFYPLVLSDRFKMAHSGDIKIYEDVREGRWVMVPRRCRVAETESEALTWMRTSTFDPETTLILIDADVSETAAVCGADVRASPRVTSAVPVRYRSGAIDVEVETSDPVWLLVKEAWYPGWRATLRPEPGSGTSKAQTREVPVVRGDLLMMAVPVPAGRWRVELSYRPRVLGWGAVLSAVGWLSIAVYAGFYAQRPCRWGRSTWSPHVQ